MLSGKRVSRALAPFDSGGLLAVPRHVRPHALEVRLGEVVRADPNEPDLTLVNIIAQQQAAKLLATSDEYF